MNSYVGAKAQKVVVSESAFSNDIDKIIRTQGEPFGSTSIYAQYRVYQLARQQGITVTIDGQGADELFAGYMGYSGQRLRSLLETKGLMVAWRFLDMWSQWPGRSRRDAFKLLMNERTNNFFHHILRQFDGRNSSPKWIRVGPLSELEVRIRYPRQIPELDLPGRRMMAELAFALNRRGLPKLLRHGDRNSMIFGIESRVPFLTLEQAEFLLSLPENFLISDTGETKSVCRAAMRNIVPEKILDRRDKVGFHTPERARLFSNSNTLRQWLSDDIGLPFLDQSTIIQEFDAIIAGRNKFSWQVWRWINFIRWYQLFFV